MIRFHLFRFLFALGTAAIQITFFFPFLLHNVFCLPLQSNSVPYKTKN